MLTKRSNVVEERLRLIIDTIPTIVWRKLPDGSADFLNRNFREYTGLSLEHGLGWGWMNTFHPDDRPEGGMARCFGGREPFEKEARLRRADGAVSLVPNSRRAAARQAEKCRQMVWNEHRHRRPEKGRRSRSAHHQHNANDGLDAPPDAWLISSISVVWTMRAFPWRSKLKTRRAQFIRRSSQSHEKVACGHGCWRIIRG